MFIYSINNNCELQRLMTLIRLNGSCHIFWIFAIIIYNKLCKFVNKRCCGIVRINTALIFRTCWRRATLSTHDYHEWLEATTESDKGDDRDGCQDDAQDEEEETNRIWRMIRKMIDWSSIHCQRFWCQSVGIWMRQSKIGRRWLHREWAPHETALAH